jgi:hypothetical protein
VAPTAPHVERARRDAARGDWHAVRTTLIAARAHARAAGDDLDLQDLDLLHQAAWWLGRGVEAMALDEEIYHRLEALARTDEAARRALDLGLQWATRGDIVVARAWLGRARRLLTTVPITPTMGFLRYAEATMDMDVYGDPRGATVVAEELLELGRVYGEPALTTFARVLQGFAGIRSGSVGAGFEALDEAMLDVLSGQVPPLWCGDIFCTVIHVSHQLGDWARMRAWTTSLERWALPLSRTFMYTAVTRVHQLELAGAQGEWDRVEREMAEPSEELVGSHGWVAGAGFHELGEVRRLRGDLTGAAAAYARSRELGTDPQPGAALLACAVGRPEEAVATLRLSLAASGPLERSRLLLPTVQAALAVSDVVLARSSAVELVETATRYGTPELRANAAHATALLELHSGE